MIEEKRWPAAGDRLLHRFRKRQGEVVAEVVSVDRRAGKVVVRVGGTEYASLSGAARAVAGHAANGWVFWRLKRQTGKKPLKGGLQ